MSPFVLASWNDKTLDAIESLETVHLHKKYKIF